MFAARNVDDTVEFRCSIVGYQFPDAPTDDWCLVRIALRQGSETFERVDPALEAPDLLKLREWFDCLANDRLPTSARLSFVEPCLAFAYHAKRSGRIRFELQLGAELAPPFPLKQFGTSDPEWQIVFALEPSRLTEVVTELDTVIERFPIRSRLSERPPGDG